MTDPSDAVVSGAKVTITNLATAQLIKLSTNSSGSFNSGALVPGKYKTQVSAKGFATAEVSRTVLVGNTATVNVNLQIGNEKEVVDVQGSALQVNTEQPTVQGVLNEQQIENLPVNGRNFLDLAQLEPGFRFRMERTLARTAIPPSPLAAVSAAPLESRWMGSTSRMRHSARPLRTSLQAVTCHPRALL